MRHRILLAILCLLPTAACTGSEPDTQKPRLAYVSNGVASFWTIAEAGALKAGRDLDVDVDVRMPVEGVLDQKRIVAYVSNGVASFWTIAEAGALKAGRDLDVDVDVRMPVEGVLDQKRIVEDLLARESTASPSVPSTRTTRKT